MDAIYVNIIDFLTNNQQLLTPIYHRDYSWSEKECKCFLNDIMKVGKNKDAQSYFVGSIVLKKVNNDLIDKLLIIDGKQRIITLYLLIIALSEFSNEDLLNKFLINIKGKNADKYKLKLNGRDNDKFTRIIESNYNFEDDSKIIKNYILIKNLVKDNFKLFYDGLMKLSAVNIFIKEENPQILYNNLNTNALELNQLDLVRNYIFLDLPLKKQKLLYDEYWRRIDKEFKKDNQSFYKFMKYYLSFKINKNIDSKDIYKYFKEYVDKIMNRETIIKDIFNYAENFFNIKVEKEKTCIKNCLIGNSIKNLDYSKKPFIYIAKGNKMEDLFQSILEKILDNFNPINIVLKKQTIQFNINKETFFDIEPQEDSLILTINMPFNKINDPKGLCQDVSEIRHIGLGDIELKIDYSSDVNYVLFLINQSFYYNMIL